MYLNKYIKGYMFWTVIMNQKQTPFLIEQYAIWYSRYDWISHLQKFELFDDWTWKLNTLYRNFISAFLFNLKFFEMSILYCFSFIVFCLTFYHNWRHLETKSEILRLNVWIPEESFLTDIYLFCPLYDTEWKCKLKRVFDWHIFHIV